MVHSLDRLNPDYLESNTNNRVGRKIIVYKSTASTNDVAWNYAISKVNDGIAIFAEMQTLGRGRRLSKWFSEDGSSVLCSVLLKNEKLPFELLNMAAAIATAEAIGECGSNYPTIKWSNDVFINTNKIAGILIEAKADDFVIGIGINCHQQPIDFPEELRQQATSIDIQNSSRCDRNFVAKRLLISLEEWICAAKNDISKVKERWKQLCPLIGTNISILHNNNIYKGYCKDIDPQYGLVLVLENGAVRMFDAAQSSIFKGSQ